MFKIYSIKLVKPIWFQQVSRYAKYVQKSKEELKAELESKRFNSVRNAITSALKQRRYLSVEEWKSVGEQLKADYDLRNMHNFNKIIFAALLSLRPPNDSLQNARHYIETSNLEKDLNVKRSLIELYAKKESEGKLTAEEEKDIIQMCDEFIGQEFHLFPEMHSKITQGLCATKDWKRALSLSPTFNTSLNTLMRKTLRENEFDLVWDLLNKLTELNSSQNPQISNRTVIGFAKYFQRYPKSIPINADKFLTFCERMEKVFNEESAREFTKAMQNAGYAATTTNMNYSGTCNVCKETLDAVKITKKDFNLVKNQFMKKVVKGADIYQKTTPEEWEAFVRLIHENGPFDIVMDGLNVSYLANPKNYKSNERKRISEQVSRQRQRPCSFALSNAVKQLVEDGKRVLVIGRKHMNNWPNMKSIYHNATVFLVDNISKDDIFMLYASLYSGPDCYILSNDFMRQHKFAIGRYFDKLFKLWQQEHWYGFTIGQNKTIDLNKPMQFKMYCHKVGDSWHLPFKSDKEIELNTWSYYDLPKNWACIRFESKEKI